MLSFSNAIFISDLHLTEDRPECTRAFFQFLNWLPETTEALFILGDYFEYWVGDDVPNGISDSIASALSDTLTKKNIKGFFISGNRDFAIGGDYCSQSNLTQLKDSQVISISDQRVLVSHGDEYCTDDVSYQRYRKIIRNPIVLKILLALPKSYRLSLAERLRQKSKQKFQNQPVSIDVNTNTIEQTLTQQRADILVHGHTHLANIHNHNNDTSRLVLGDWFEFGWYGTINEEGPSLTRFSVKEPVFE